MPVARTEDEGRLYLDLHPCRCGSVKTDWSVDHRWSEGEYRSMEFTGACSVCGRRRSFTFEQDSDDGSGTWNAGWPDYGGERPSRLFDPGQWMRLADRVAGGQRVEGAEGPMPLIVAVKCMEEIMKFVPYGGERVPPGAFWTAEGTATYHSEPGRFDLDRLQVVANTYRGIRAEHFRLPHNSIARFLP